MLCLNCGKDNGDTIGLCAACSNQGAEEGISGASTPEQDISAAAPEAESHDALSAPLESVSTPSKSAEPSVSAAVKKKSNQPSQTKRASVREGASAKVILIPLALLVALGIAYAVLQGSQSADQAATPQDAELIEEPTEEATEEKEPAVASEPFPTAPHLVNGMISDGTSRYFIKDAVFIYFPFSKKIELGLYQEPLTIEQKEQTLTQRSLSTAPDTIRPFALYTFYTEEGMALCSPQLISGFSAQFASQGSDKPLAARADFGAAVGGVTNFACQLKQGAPFAVELAQNASVKGADGAEQFQ